MAGTIKKMNNKETLDGILLINKPKNISSFGIIKKIKKKINIKKIGHCGTLDPIATGLLILCVGNSTKISPYLEGLDKKYIAKIKLGQSTDTYDTEGVIINENNLEVSIDDIKKVINTFKGIIEQTPPIYSAVKIKGKPAYKYARNGEKVNIKSRKVKIHSIEIIDFTYPYLTIDVHCSKGTYIRSLGDDIGNKLGTGAHLVELNRTKIGIFSIDNSISIDDDEKTIINSVINKNEALKFIPDILVKSEHKKDIKNGKKINISFFHPKEYIFNKNYRVTDDNHNLLAIVELKNKEEIIYKRVFRD